MNWRDSAKIKSVLIRLSVVIVLGSGRASADFTFGELTNIGYWINAYDAWDPSLSSDGLELYFTYYDVHDGHGRYDIWVSKRESKTDPWDRPENLGSTINSDGDEFSPCISSDGLSLFYSALTWPNKDDLFVTTRTSTYESWGQPENLGTVVNSSSDDIYPTITADGLTLIFCSNRSGTDEWDLWVTTRPTLNDDWCEPVNIGEPVNSVFPEADPSISSDGLWLFFASDRPDISGGVDIWLSRRLTINDPWQTPVNLGPAVNSSDYDATPNISYDGSVLLFASYREGGHRGTDIWQVSIEPVVDFNGDGAVDLNDLVILIENWGSDNSLCDIGPTPLGDGAVDTADLEVFMEHWQR